MPKVTFSATEDTLADLRDIAGRRRVTCREVLIGAIQMEAYLDWVRITGGKILIYRPAKTYDCMYIVTDDKVFIYRPDEIFELVYRGN